MTTLITSPQFTPSHDVKNAGVIKYKENPLKGLIKKDHEGQVKRAALGGSALMTLLYLFAVAKGQKKSAFKLRDMFKLDFGALSTIGLATSSVIGGLTGGLIADKKENRKPKLKEAIHQFLGNIVTPITIVGVATSQIKKHNFDKFTKWTLNALAGVVGVATGVTGGNYIASKVNERIFKENDDRKVGIKDFGIHVDDILTVIALATAKKKDVMAQTVEELPQTGIQKFISKALPAIFLICGYEAGTKTAADVNKNLNVNKDKAKSA